ncbi:hypothetical protein JXA40_09705 [bacterium]|nr:hypothetical protein [candidate division CSSED10-310 bacterium]
MRAPSDYEWDDQISFVEKRRKKDRQKPRKTKARHTRKRTEEELEIASRKRLTQAETLYPDDEEWDDDDDFIFQWRRKGTPSKADKSNDGEAEESPNKAEPEPAGE